MILIPCHPYLIWLILLTIPQIEKKKKKMQRGEREKAKEREWRWRIRCRLEKWCTWSTQRTSMASLRSFSARFMVASLRYVTIIAIFSVNLSLWLFITVKSINVLFIIFPFHANTTWYLSCLLSIFVIIRIWWTLYLDFFFFCWFFPL